MSNLDVIQKFIGMVETHDTDGLRNIFADDFIGKGPSFELNQEQLIAYMDMLHIAFPDIRFNFTDIEETGNEITFNAQEQGTHTGILDVNAFGIALVLPPTNKSFKLPKTFFTARIVDGKITFLGEDHAEGAGLSGLLAQLGVEIP